MLTTDLGATAGGSASAPQRPDGADGQTGGVVAMSKALALAQQLERIVGDLRVDAVAFDLRERELTDIIVGLLMGKAWAREAARSDAVVGPKYREADDDERAEAEREFGGDHELPF